MRTHTIFFRMLFLISGLMVTITVQGQDTCMVNDQCEEAILIPGIKSDSAFVCIPGCNLYAAPDAVLSTCQMGDFPTVWYQVTVDNQATVMNIEVSSTDFEAPAIAVFKPGNSCTDLEPIPLANTSMSCIIGADGTARAVGTKVTPASTYLIAVSSYLSIGGDFRVCISTISRSSYCVTDRDIEIKARSSGGPLEGPFEPGETISICLNVNEFTEQANGCQWFQGLVPVFGNGWAPSSFDSLDMPREATVNGHALPLAPGLYDTAFWSWFNDISYHHDHPTLNISDLDQNGRLDICNSIYESDCPQKGVDGGCCGPCWEDDPGDTLPGGWFSFGINGTCMDSLFELQTVTRDWGDGNTCSSGMGPWKFCFDLKTRETPDCMGPDSTRRDLSIGFITFADGEIGAWTGGPSVCSLDQPAKATFNAQCGRVRYSDIENLPSKCHGDILDYPLFGPDISSWEWNLSPFEAIPYSSNQAENGFVILAQLVNTSEEPIDITGIAIGRREHSLDVDVKRFRFKLYNEEDCTVLSEQDPIVLQSRSLKIYPSPADDYVFIDLKNVFKTESTIQVFNTLGQLVFNHTISLDHNFQVKLDSHQFVPGLYTVVFTQGGAHSIGKFVKR